MLSSQSRHHPRRHWRPRDPGVFKRVILSHVHPAAVLIGILNLSRINHPWISISVIRWRIDGRTDIYYWLAPPSHTHTVRAKTSPRRVTEVSGQNATVGVGSLLHQVVCRKPTEGSQRHGCP